MIDESKEGERGQGRKHCRGDNLEKEAKLGRPIEPGGLDQFIRNALDELTHEENAEGVSEVRGHHFQPATLSGRDSRRSDKAV